jgi:alpha-beta hydrolase superfamily lysophospholipase
MMLVSALLTLMISLVAMIVVAVILAYWPWKQQGFDKQGLDFTATLAGSAVPLPTKTVSLRDGYPMTIREIAGPPNTPLVILIHGSAWHGMQFETLGKHLAASADVLIPDLRGHGVSPRRRGDIDYIGQLEDDIKDLIDSCAKPGQKVVLLGHSSGGGLVVRFAGGNHAKSIDGAVLLAPFLQHDAPTMRPHSGGWTVINLPRIIGLSILNRFGITALNHQSVIRFNMPKAVLDGPYGHTVTKTYSYRLNTSYAPRRNWKSDVATLPRFLLIASSDDEAFIANAYQKTMEPLTKNGTYLIVPGVNHLDLVNTPEVLNATTAFLEEK